MTALVFAQFALAAHVCPLQGPVAPEALAQTPTQAGPAEHMCAGSADAAAASAATNVCEVHCTGGVTLPASPDLPAVALVALPVPATPGATVETHDDAARTPYAALPGAPPLTLQYCRLLN